MAAMTKAKYKNLIQKQLSALGIEGKNYDSVIDSLALILVQRDETRKEFEENGGKSVIEYTNKGGSTNMTKNPILVIWDELNKTALAYWRELGLTPSSYKKLTGDGVKKDTRQKGLAAALAEIES
ncbi:MAG: P27 family phage terminase small subunit [Anaerotignum sp.]|uniref:P27 family phage terminase small subunit n=1 Tax=Anaerotignum sp. TaxID=2039241 RepID=UPI0015AF7258|nr:P27 family phage terminase small subunit [Anaerotignum sp.]MEE0700345.1 P27 family phage terminase small subunit [Anaerotignum sp.]DAX44587.1 MAG TPA: terminase small subunit [Caudoviricetes sp.]